ncbi:MAG: hypothetical protein J6S85_01985 [Methanobrevibacter sp.]|nr:hypothetical protein [Methanobrevibacter sp.]
MYNICDDVYMVCYWNSDESKLEIYDFNISSFNVALEEADDCKKEKKILEQKIYIIKHKYIHL